ncbi:MAG: phosphodiester glycosidase family protein [Muribaculaceae bacterium]|nr:phosphodiester glycosidase family protein [Muribaculaceae bacterium]
MKKILSLVATAAIVFSASAESLTIPIQGTDYRTDILINRDLGPGVNYKRLRIPDFPLNVNMVTMDLTNPYNRVETTQGGEQLGKTEKLANAYTRQYTAEKRPLAGANGNFWCVSGQWPWAEYLVGATFNGNVRNGEIITETNAHTDWWGHNNGSPGCVAITPTKEMYIDFMYYRGYVSNEKLGTLVIHQSNKLVRDGEIGLYNHFFGRDKSFIPADQYADESGTQRLRRAEGVSTEVYLKINEGNEWMVGRPMACTVQEVKTNAGAGKLGDYDLCLMGRGANKDLLASLVPGDVLTIDLKWLQPNGNAPEFEQLIGGNGVVMVDGVLTDLNTVDSYNSKTYSRTAYGTTADRKTLINVVIDMSVDPVYGKSAGCNTFVMCDIMKYFGCTNIMNMDAGGSAQMMVEGKVINKTTEGAPRAVANGWFFYSIAPQDDVVTRLEFEECTLQAPIYAQYKPVILAYNQYGDLIDKDLQGFTLSCPDSLGTCDGMRFIAGGKACTSELTATYNGVSVTKKIDIVDAEIAMRIKPILIDATREYKMEVTAQIGENVYTYDAASIEWTVADKTVADIDENGVLRGYKEGSTQVVGLVGEFLDTTMVNVEIAKAAQVSVADMTGWTIKGSSGITKGALAEDGTLSFTYGAPRAATIQMSKDIRYYSLPDKLWMEFTPTVNIKSINIDLRSPQHTKINKLELKPSTGEVWESGKTHRIELPISELGDPADLILYPLSLHYINFTIETNSAYKGEQSIKISELSAEYNNYASVEQIIVGEGSGVKIYPNPTTDGVFTVTSSKELKCVDVYSIAGVAVASVECEGNAVTVNAAGLAKGVYFVKVETEVGVSTSKLVVK